MSDPSWVIKAGGKADAEVPEYLHDWDRMVPTNSDEVVWTEDQRLAWRFYDRNNAAVRCHSFPVCAYSDDVRVVKLVRPLLVQGKSADTDSESVDNRKEST